MYIIIVDYKESIEKIEYYLSDHRRFLQEAYDKNQLLISGPRNPRDGGIIISNMKSVSDVHDLMKKDPFFIHDLIEYRVIEMEPTRYHESLNAIFSSNEQYP